MVDVYQTTDARANIFAASFGWMGPINEAPAPVSGLMRRLMAEREITFRELALATRQADDRDKGLSGPYLSQIAGGATRPSAYALELIARTLDVSPYDFLEYRLARARRLLDEEQVGLGRATVLLGRLMAALEESGEPFADELGELLPPVGSTAAAIEEAIEAVQQAAQETPPSANGRAGTRGSRAANDSAAEPNSP